jgi:aerobic-type carbon monoxide dehydrogenase small subunit (CoxS/CutS family)
VGSMGKTDIIVSGVLIASVRINANIASVRTSLNTNPRQGSRAKDPLFFKTLHRRVNSTDMAFVIDSTKQSLRIALMDLSTMNDAKCGPSNTYNKDKILLTDSILKSHRSSKSIHKELIKEKRYQCNFCLFWVHRTLCLQ